MRLCALEQAQMRSASLSLPPNDATLARYNTHGYIYYFKENLPSGSYDCIEVPKLRLRR
jgi:hypothetical protein